MLLALLKIFILEILVFSDLADFNKNSYNRFIHQTWCQHLISNQFKLPLTAGPSLIVYQLVYNVLLYNDQIKMSLVFIVWSLTEQVNMQIVTLRLDTLFLAGREGNGLTCVLIKFLTSVPRYLWMSTQRSMKTRSVMPNTSPTADN